MTSTIMASHKHVAGLTALLVCVCLLPLIRRAASHFRLHDAPGPLKIHNTPVPRLGGVAIVVAMVLGVTSSGFGLSAETRNLYGALAVIWFTGLADDLVNLSPAARLVGQLGAGFLLSQTPWCLQLSGNPIADAILSCLFVAIFVNAFNFLDGTDGVAAGVAGMIGFGYAAVYSTPPYTISSALAWVLLGSCLGFLVFNFPPAKIFMGDSGSTSLGFIVAFLSLDFYRVHPRLGTRWLLPLLFAAVPLLDFLLAVARRLHKRVSPFSGDRQHFYDLLLERGWPPVQVALGAYATTAALLVVGWLCIGLRWQVCIALWSVTVACLVAIAVRLGAFRREEQVVFDPRLADPTYAGVRDCQVLCPTVFDSSGGENNGANTPR
jgi:UDP-GlcNAc:undecaprenyl-phosphate GlcNAc-1-phosphate transferase